MPCMQCTSSSRNPPCCSKARPKQGCKAADLHAYRCSAAAAPGQQLPVLLSCRCCQAAQRCQAAPKQQQQAEELWGQLRRSGRSAALRPALSRGRAPQAVQAACKQSLGLPPLSQQVGDLLRIMSSAQRCGGAQRGQAVHTSGSQEEGCTALAQGPPAGPPSPLTRSGHFWAHNGAGKLVGGLAGAGARSGGTVASVRSVGLQLACAMPESVLWP